MEYDISSLKAFYADFTKRIDDNYRIILKESEETKYEVTQLPAMLKLLKSSSKQ